MPNMSASEKNVILFKTINAKQPFTVVVDSFTNYICCLFKNLKIMAENLFIPGTDDKEAKYKSLLPQIEALIGKETDLIANLANTAAALHQTFGFFWVGFYLVKSEELVLAPFQGPVACTRIKRGRGVCGAAWESARTIIVPDVEQFPGHIACNSESKSEIVIPLISDNTVFGVLDIDSDKLNDFDDTDKVYLENICRIIEKSII